MTYGYCNSLSTERSTVALQTLYRRRNLSSWLSVWFVLWTSSVCGYHGDFTKLVVRCLYSITIDRIIFSRWHQWWWVFLDKFHCLLLMKRYSFQDRQWKFPLQVHESECKVCAQKLGRWRRRFKKCGTLTVVYSYHFKWHVHFVPIYPTSMNWLCLVRITDSVGK